LSESAVAGLVITILTLLVPIVVFALVAFFQSLPATEKVRAEIAARE